MSKPDIWTDYELHYAAEARCQCGAGLAYPLDHEDAFRLRAWICSAVMKNEAVGNEHDRYPFNFYKILEEESINNGGGYSTRSAGTVARTVGMATCPSCQHKWQSEPYNANGRGHHWYCGPCPECGYAIGSAGRWSSAEGKPIELRYKTVVLRADEATLGGLAS